MLPANTFRKLTGYLPQFLVFAVKNFPLVRVVLGLILTMVVLEYATLSLMVPLVQGSAGISGKPGALGEFWNHGAELPGFPPSQQTWLWMFLVLLGMRILAGYLQITLNVSVAKQIHALDIYFWLTYRSSYLRQARVIPRSALQLQFGASYRLDGQRLETSNGPFCGSSKRSRSSTPRPR